MQPVTSRTNQFFTKKEAISWKKYEEHVTHQKHNIVETICFRITDDFNIITLPCFTVILNTKARIIKRRARFGKRV